jgi:hypothetical protein
MVRIIGLTVLVSAFLLSLVVQAQPQTADTPYPHMICFNAPAARSYLPLTIAKTKWVLAEKSKTQMFDTIQAAFDRKELPALKFGSMCSMISKEGYLSDRDGHWHPHLMFFVPLTDAKAWGAGLPGSPIFAGEDTLDRLTVFLVPISKWSDGTADSDKN